MRVISLMKTQIKQALEALWWPIKDEKSLNRVLWAIKARKETHWKVFLSRKENKKFWISERQLQKIIKWFRELWLLVYIWRERKPWNKFTSCVYEVSEKLKSILNMLIIGIKDMYEKVWEWTRTNWSIKVLEFFWVTPFKEKWRYRLLVDKNTSIWRYWQIKNWKTEKTYSIFTYLMEFKWLSCFQLAKELKL